MAASSWAGALTAMFTMVTACLVLVGAIVARRTGKKVDQVHEIVNQQRTDAQNYQRALIRALQEHDIKVPVDQSISEEPPPNK